MRDIWLVAWLLLGIGCTFRFPFVGVLIWEWLSLMAPHQEAYGFSRALPLNLIVAGATLISWLASKEPKKISWNAVSVLFLLFLAWTTFNSFFAFDPAWSWPFWDRTWRVLALGFVMAATATNRVRIDAIIWVAAISLMYYGVKGGIFTIQSGGVYKVYGPESSIIGDNNQLALALLMVLPLIEYLRSTTSSRLLRWILAGSMAATTISVLGSYSRGAYVAMVAIAVFFLFQVRRPFLYLIAGAAVIIPALNFMPQDFWDRVGTIGSANTDGSFHGRWIAWQVAYKYAVDHFPFGAGFYGPQLHPIFNSYFPTEDAHAAHSIYFQVLGEHGFIGLFIYLAIVVWSLILCWAIVKKTKYAPNVWSHRLARMTQISLLAFYIGGAALSMAYYDLFVILVFLLPLLAALSPETARVRPKWRAVSTGENLPALSPGANG